MSMTEVYVAVYHTKYDIELRVFALEEQAWEWRDAIAREGWADTFGKSVPIPDFEVGQQYFDEARKFFSLSSDQQLVYTRNAPINFTVHPATIDWPECASTPATINN